MFMELKAPFAKDAKVPVTLVFEKAGSIDVDLAWSRHGRRSAAHCNHRPLHRRANSALAAYIACNSTQAIMAMPITDTNQASVRSQGTPTT